MIFRIYRTSDLWHTIQEQPCKNAFCKDYGDYNHWYIEINSLEDLEKLEKEVDCELIIRNIGGKVDFLSSYPYINIDDKAVPYIEIYDEDR